ncbi:tetratricopeptide repeat protein [Deinococcus arcticus]|uniref:Uncharacterized protein n=1 Tax=Deinococcus arcticus TaxID=2136176 RepID=A0A2T3W3Y7_9DEIO|nr:tetratricopeptide repeat protein [Deinococcus arcticus]PTA66621.1 hypothetical protein C8263_16765 [Deinococcus arcticus]
MPVFDEVTEQLGHLVQQGDWERVRLHADWALRHLQTRADGLALAEALHGVPAHFHQDRGWAEVLGSVAYRTGNLQALKEVLASWPPATFPALEAYAALLGGHVQQALTLSAACPPDDAIAARVWPRATYEARGDWRAAYGAVLGRLRGRDRALVRTEYALSLANSGDDLAARTAYTTAAAEYGADAWGRASALANRGMTCVRLDDLRTAERALTEALRLTRRPEAAEHRALVWRGLGAVWRRHGEYARALVAFQQAGQQLKDLRAELPLAVRGAALCLMLRAEVDAALDALSTALVDLGVDSGAPHRLHLDLAMGMALNGDITGAAQALSLAQLTTADDRLAAAVVTADLQRQRGKAVPPGPPPGRAAWTEELACLFPELFMAWGRSVRRPEWRVQVQAAGPVEVRMHGEKLPLRPDSDAAALLVLLLLHGGTLNRERVTEELFGGASLDRQRRRLAEAVRQLRLAFGWPEAVCADGHVLALSTEPTWLPLTVPPPAQASLFCAGRYDNWVQEWREVQDGAHVI